jgi:hypothetical protein
MVLTVVVLKHAMKEALMMDLSACATMSIGLVRHGTVTRYIVMNVIVYALVMIFTIVV